MKNTKWLKELLQAFKHYNNTATLKQIYEYMHKFDFSEYEDSNIFDSQIRRLIYSHSSDCEIYNGKEDLFFSENGKGKGIWTLRSDCNIDSIETLKKLPLGSLVTATDIAKISGQNQTKGIHPLKINNQIIGAAILCTINGEYYKNEWLDKPLTLKYYLEGRTVNGNKQYNPLISSNKTVQESTNENPLYVFVRSNKSEKFTYYGNYIFNSMVNEADGGKYFILQAINSKPDIEALISIEDIESFPEGKLKERKHIYRERNPRLIKQAKEQFKLTHNNKLFCEICSFNFEERYGSELGQNFIEAHHLIPISELKDGDQTKIEDLIMVCSNCHRMIHRKRPWIANKSELKSILN